MPAYVNVKLHDLNLDGKVLQRVPDEFYGREYQSKESAVSYNHIEGPTYTAMAGNADAMRMTRARVEADVRQHADAMNYHLIEAKRHQLAARAGQSQLHQGLPSTNDPDLDITIPDPVFFEGIG